MFRFRFYKGFCRSITLLLSLLWLNNPSVWASTFTAEQQTYLDARQALDKKQFKQYQKLRQLIPNYPLNIYLDYHEQGEKIMSMKGADALTAINHFNTTPLYNTLRHRYLTRTGSQKRWNDFLTIAKDAPNDITLQCYYYRAQLQRGDKALAYKGAETIWHYGYSRPKACDPLFKQWTRAGERTDAHIWSRMLLSFNAGQSSLLQYLARKLPQHKQDTELLLKVYRDPRSLRHTKRFSSEREVVGDIVQLGLRKLAKRDLNQAAKLFVKYQKAGRFSDYEGRKLNRYIVRRALIRQHNDLKQHIDTMLPLLESDDLYEIRLRWAILEQDEVTINRYLPLLSDKAKSSDRWQYWQARMAQQSSPGTTTQKLDKLSNKRNFYGFYAANSLEKSLSMNDEQAKSSATLRAKLSNDPAFERVIELKAIDRQIDARNEWIHLLRRQPSLDMRKEYGIYALEQQWHDLSVESSIQAKAWNNLALRFPQAETSLFTKASKKYQVDQHEVRAISRRESAFYPYATSGVGARGLMQVMPATAKQTAKKFNIKYAGTRSLYQPETSIMLGSAYYSQLLKRYKYNRVLATAAYNAGPSNVNRWLKKSDGKLDVMSFIETIPFRETREYVQAVFSYRLIFQHYANEEGPMFSEQEQQYAY
ncbi:transglycosylase SLT domain-containing protein [Shewanella maritima]|uniref:transglycosylase SLT domain-containing protein n=1 Tax=Shewanella maritima TaxID=2520507 RepID=UPI003735BDDE